MTFQALLALVFNLCFISSTVHAIDQQYPPTQGEVWPMPQLQTKNSSFHTFDPASFSVEVINQNCSILMKAITRYVYTLNKLNELTNRTSTEGVLVNIDSKNKSYIQNLLIDLSSPCEDYPHLNMDESYNLSVASTSVLRSSSIWGILRGLETFSQLFFVTDDLKEIRINETEIFDFPRYSHRGLLIDTSRHFISMPNILKNLDAMAMNKMNVLHWHIVDDQSFPYQSEKFPELSNLGAYHSSMIYTKNDIANVIEYARDRGIRVIPEFDVPGHTRSWGAAYPNILTECYQEDKFAYLGPMNPIKNMTYKLIGELFQEVQDLFPDSYFHVGGDEVEFSCWLSNPDIDYYMILHNFSNPQQLHALFMANTITLLKQGSKPIVWQEVFDERVPLSNDSLIQIWKSHSLHTLLSVLQSGYKALFSSAWYLDHLDRTFMDFYVVDPRQMVIHTINNTELAENVVGGEACMWGEMVDDTNFLSRIWPRSSAVAERLWSPGIGYTLVPGYFDKSQIPAETLRRISEHVCRMIRRNIPAQPAVGPGFCIA